MIFWIIVIVGFLALEAATVGLVCIWFAVGGVAALIACALKLDFWVQVVVFLGVSGLVLAVLRPVARKYLNSRRKPTNADRVIGMIAPVTETIDNIAGTGAVVVSGKTWTARSASGGNVAEGALVKILSIQGVKLIVEEAKPAQVER